ncbi:hypothetical protein POTG_03809 [Paenibacillus sp. oral taxon 786 str. D14]|nr:hypothetical protein POTG_03809 [Paenibacillus sp. oral taxon 786 str. D14]
MLPFFFYARLSRPVHSHYDKELFAARRSIIAGSKLYAPMHETIARIINPYAGDTASAPLVADMGCGEGSHLQGILRQLERPDGLGVGIDLSKEPSGWLPARLVCGTSANRSVYAAGCRRNHHRCGDSDGHQGDALDGFSAKRYHE